MRHRPIGIGVQGLADVFAMLNFSFDSEEACELLSCTLGPVQWYLVPCLLL